MITRRGFMAAILASAAAPAIVRADALMRIVPRDALLVDATVTELLQPWHMTIAEWMAQRHPLGIWQDIAAMREGEVITLADSPMRYVVTRNG